ncbi:MAG: Wzz/FepE/Etk N-terminal domain-containing protein, partial [Syntrophales bacterium LBB04]|nr:Wzz/FepE/Etk N-terminal domain-containing protein [Syntrophales bacterium LBB04]
MKSPSDKTALQPLPASISGASPPSTLVRRPSPDFQDSQDIRDYLEIVLRHKWLVGTFLVGVFITTLVVSLSMKPVFKASGRLELTLQAPKVTKFEDLLATQLQTKEFMQTQVTLLQSEALARRVIEKLHLTESPAFNPRADKAFKEKDEGLLQKWKNALKELLPSTSDRKAVDPRTPRLTLGKSVQ